METIFWVVIIVFEALVIAVLLIRAKAVKEREDELQDRVAYLQQSGERYYRQLLTLQKRITKYERSITWVKTPETDIRVLQSKVREQLSIDLVSDGLISFTNREIPREDKKAVEVIVTGTIKVLKP